MVLYSLFPILFLQVKKSRLFLWCTCDRSFQMCLNHRLKEMCILSDQFCLEHKCNGIRLFITKKMDSHSKELNWYIWHCCKPLVNVTKMAQKLCFRGIPISTAKSFKVCGKSKMKKNLSMKFPNSWYLYF